MNPRGLFDIGDEFYGVGMQDADFLGLLIQEHPEWTTVVEFGTYLGMTALWMASVLQQQNGRLITIDLNDGRSAQVKSHWLFNMDFFTLDILERPHNEGVARLIAMSAPCLVVMDNGNKIQEVNTYAPMIQPGSAFCVHDWGTVSLPGPGSNGEVCMDDIKDTLTNCNYTSVMHDKAESMDSKFRCWVRG